MEKDNKTPSLNKGRLQGGSPLVSIIMGSTSDLPVMEKAMKFLDDMEIPFEVNALRLWNSLPKELQAGVLRLLLQVLVWLPPYRVLLLPIQPFQSLVYRSKAVCWMVLMRFTVFFRCLLASLSPPLPSMEP